jgi:hypothetical protein
MTDILRLRHAPVDRLDAVCALRDARKEESRNIRQQAISTSICGVRHALVVEDQAARDRYRVIREAAKTAWKGRSLETPLHITTKNFSNLLCTQIHKLSKNSLDSYLSVSRSTSLSFWKTLAPARTRANIQERRPEETFNIMNYLIDPVDQTQIHLSAQDVADMVGTSKSQILYWGRAKYLDRRETGQKVYPFSEVRKAKLLDFLVNDIGLDGEKASGIAKGLLRSVEDKPESVQTLLELLRAMHDDLDGVLESLASTDLHKKLVGAGMSDVDKKGSGL